MKMTKKYLRLDEDIIKTFYPTESIDEIKKTKRNIALIEVLRRIPKKDYQDIIIKFNKTLFHLFIPGHKNFGYVHSFPITHPKESRSKKRDREARAEVLYLSPILEKQNKEIIVAVVAHEIAHIFLKHSTIYYGEKLNTQEKEAWQLIIKWGFESEFKKWKAFRKKEMIHESIPKKN